MYSVYHTSQMINDKTPSYCQILQVLVFFFPPLKEYVLILAQGYWHRFLIVNSRKCWSLQFCPLTA